VREKPFTSIQIEPGAAVRFPKVETLEEGLAKNHKIAAKDRVHGSSKKLVTILTITFIAKI